MNNCLNAARILVVDDNAFVTKAVSAILARLSIAEIIPAGDTDAGIEAINRRDGEIDAALVDFQMPGRHGLQFIKDVRTGKTRAPTEIPCLMLTDHVDPRLLGLAMALDVDAFLKKPADLEEMRNHLSRVLSDRRPVERPDYYARIEVEHSLAELVARISGGADQNAGADSGTGRMIDLGIDGPPEGATLARDLVNGAGQALLKSGTVLDESNLALLKSLMLFDPTVARIWVDTP